VVWSTVGCHWAGAPPGNGRNDKLIGPGGLDLGGCGRARQDERFGLILKPERDVRLGQPGKQFQRLGLRAHRRGGGRGRGKGTEGLRHGGTKGDGRRSCDETGQGKRDCAGGGDCGRGGRIAQVQAARRVVWSLGQRFRQ